MRKVDLNCNFKFIYRQPVKQQSTYFIGLAYIFYGFSYLNLIVCTEIKYKFKRKVLLNLNYIYFIFHKFFLFASDPLRVEKG